MRSAHASVRCLPGIRLRRNIATLMRTSSLRLRTWPWSMRTRRQSLKQPSMTSVCDPQVGCDHAITFRGPSPTAGPTFTKCHDDRGAPVRTSTLHLLTLRIATQDCSPPPCPYGGPKGSSCITSLGSKASWMVVTSQYVDTFKPHLQRQHLYPPLGVQLRPSAP